MLRQEAANLGISTEKWDRPDSPPIDTEQEHRRTLLGEQEQSDPLTAMGDYCQVLVSFAERARAVQALNLEYGFRAVAKYWFKHYIEDREWFVRDLPGVIAFEEGIYQSHLVLHFLAQVEVLSCMQRLLTNTATQS
jgi:hypothetical protein